MISLAVADIGKRFDRRVGLFVSTGIQILEYLVSQAVLC